jgi:hypothetical protein
MAYAIFETIKQKSSRNNCNKFLNERRSLCEQTTYRFPHVLKGILKAKYSRESVLY